MGNHQGRSGGGESEGEMLVKAFIVVSLERAGQRVDWPAWIISMGSGA